jgi:radical SAM protein with 4Fe4S-binding SPASM domain
VLATGEVVPCCLDNDAVMKLGSLKEQSLSDIVYGKRATDMIDGFKEGRCSEEMCLKCAYKERFNPKNGH